MTKKNNRHTLVYIAGKYSGDTEANIQAARETALKVWDAGFTAVCPHLNTAFFERDCRCTYADYLEGDFEILKRCDAVLMLANWEESTGAVKEHHFAQYFEIPIYYSVQELRMYDLQPITQEVGDTHDNKIQ